MANYMVSDFNGAKEYFENTGAAAWTELDALVSELRLQLQPSDQKGITGNPIFDPKATNAALTAGAASRGWRRVPVPQTLRPFGLDWDGGKGSVLVEYQFSNYPFLWNNIIRTEAVFKSGDTITPLTASVEALVIITKSGCLPASNSTLYYEQADAQIRTVTTLNVFDIPIRLVGITVPDTAQSVEADWNEYPERYGRTAAHTTRRTFSVTRGRARQYGQQPIAFS